MMKEVGNTYCPERAKGEEYSLPWGWGMLIALI